MEPTGIVRSVDGAGRFVIPKELRRGLGIEGDGALLEVYTDGDSVVLRRFTERCVFCGGTEELISFNGKLLCSACAREIGKAGEESVKD